MPSTPGSTAVSVSANLHAPPLACARLPGRRGRRERAPARAPRPAAQEHPISLLWVCVGGEVEKATLMAAFGQLCASAGIAPLRMDMSAALPPPPPVASETSPRLDEPEFAAAVREALRHFTSVDLLGCNPLVRSRMVTERAGDEAGIEERVAALRTLVHEVVGSLGASPRRLKLQRALYHTYLEPAGSQERVAELLDLPFSTYRDHLKTGIQLVGEILRQRETGEGVRSAPHPIAPPARPA
jgi:hypothetical protein